MSADDTRDWPAGYRFDPAEVDPLADHIYKTCRQSSLGEGTADDPRNIAQAILASPWLSAHVAAAVESIAAEASTQHALRVEAEERARDADRERLAVVAEKDAEIGRLRKDVAARVAICRQVMADRSALASDLLASQLEAARLIERLDVVTCDVCEELIIPGEETLPTSDSWVHDDCLTEGP